MVSINQAAGFDWLFYQSDHVQLQLLSIEIFSTPILHTFFYGIVYEEPSFLSFQVKNIKGL